MVTWCYFAIEIQRTNICHLMRAKDIWSHDNGKIDVVHLVAWHLAGDAYISRVLCNFMQE